MKKFFVAASIAALLSGCAPLSHNGSLSQNEQLRIMNEVAESRKAARNDFQSYANACLAAFPDAKNLKDDGGQRMTEQWSVNISLVTSGKAIVCSVSRDVMQVERIHTGAKIMTLGEYKGYIAADSSKQAAVITAPSHEPDPPESDPRLSYKNTRLGDSKARFQAKLPLYSCQETSCSYFKSSCESTFTPGPKASTKECVAGTSYGGAAPKYGFAYFIDGKMSKVSLTIATEQMSLLDLTLTEKYGKPSKVDNTPFKNKMGNEFPNSQKTWLVEGEKLVLTYRSSIVDEGTVEIVGKAAEALSKENFDKRVKANSKDF